ncbi:Hydrophobic seed protein domain-containing protein [Hirschfeldia incana]|nr:Hydrophobic seed protein domain-containing protein [Hirschfeldia incana]
MAPRTLLPLFLFLNLLLFTYTSAQVICPTNTLQFGLCVNVLNVVDLTVGTPLVQPCCSLVQGLVALDAAACLCKALHLSILGINLTADLTVLLRSCNIHGAQGFQCV